MCFLSFLEKCQVSKTLFNVLLRSTKRSGVDSESLNRRRKKGHTHRLTSTYVDVRVCVMWSRATWYYLCPDTLYLQVWGLSISAFPHVAITHIHSLLLSDFYHVSRSLIVFFSIYPRHCVTVFFPSRSLSFFFKGHVRLTERERDQSDNKRHWNYASHKQVSLHSGNQRF